MLCISDVKWWRSEGEARLDGAKSGIEAERIVSHGT